MPEENYGTLGVTVPVKTDEPISLPTFFKNFAGSVGKGKTKGSLLIAQSTGAAAFEAMKGDATLAEDGTLTVADTAITSRKLKPTAGAKVASEDLTMSETFQDIPMSGGQLEITPSVASTLLVWAQANVGAHTGDSSVIRLLMDAEERAKDEFVEISESVTRQPLSLVDAIPLTAAKHTIKLQAKQTPGAGNKVWSALTRFTYLLVAA